jgi:hypothetical protein
LCFATIAITSWPSTTSMLLVRTDQLSLIVAAAALVVDKYASRSGRARWRSVTSRSGAVCLRLDFAAIPD